MTWRSWIGRQWNALVNPPPYVPPPPCTVAVTWIDAEGTSLVDFEETGQGKYYRSGRRNAQHFINGQEPIAMADGTFRPRSAVKSYSILLP